MRACVWVLAALCLPAAFARAEDKPNPDQLKKAYDDALVQLNNAQNTKNELAKQNENLGKQVEELKTQLAAANRQIAGLRRQVSENEEKTFYLRSYYAAWQRFLQIHPELTRRWKIFLGDDPLALPQELPLIDMGLPAAADSRAQAKSDHG